MCILDSEYDREEGVREAKIYRILAKMYNKQADIQTLIEEFRSQDIKGSQYEDDEDEKIGSQVSRASLYLETSETNITQEVTVRDLKLLRDREMRKRKSAVHLVNRKSQAYVGDSFLKFHLLQNFMFYAVLFTIPSVSVVDCHLGHSFFSYLALGAFMLIVFAIDVISLR